jgi:hypothetical protein
LRTEPLKALVIGAFVRSLSMRDVESLCEQAGLGKLPRSTASRICGELRDRFEQFKRRDLYDTQLVALFLDATLISVRPSGPKEGVLVAWGFTADGARVLLAVMLGMRESYEDWQALGRDLIARGLGAPMLIVADGAPGLIKAIEHCWPASDRQRCCVHRARSRYAKLPERPARGRRPAPAVVASRPRPSVWPTIWTRSSCICATRPDTDAAGAAPTCSSDHSAKSNVGPRSSAASPARTAASRSSGPSLICSSPTRPTASGSPSSTANDSTASDTTNPST